MAVSRASVSFSASTSTYRVTVATSQVVETAQGTQSISIKKIELNTGVTPGELETKSGSRKAVMPE